jgi:uncharacterized protein HemX
MTDQKTIDKQPKPNRMNAIAFALGCIAVIVSLGTLFLSVESRLDQNKLQLLPLTIPSLIKSVTDESIQSALKSVDSQLAEQRKTIESFQQAIAQSQGPEQLAYAKLFIRLAQLSNQNGSQAQVTIALLELAKQKLNSIQDSILIKSINDDLASLKKEKGTHPEKVLADLEQAKQLATQLQAVTPQSPDLNSARTEKKGYQRWLENLQSLFVVERINSDDQRLLSPQQIELVKASFNLQLDMASWALMQNNFKLFSYSLNHANQLVKEGFKKSIALTELETLLHQLQSTQLEQQTLNLLSYQLINN